MKKYNKTYSVAMMAQILGVSSSGFYKWLNTHEVRDKTIQTLDKQIKDEFIKSNKTYGSPRISVALTRKNQKCSKTTVARRMKTMNLVARPKHKFVHTTDSDHNLKVATNLLERKFDVEQINKVWVSDITYIRVSNYWMYLTVVIDLADRMVVGWSLSKDMTATNTVIEAFSKAVRSRGITKESKLMVHSDRGVQYASREFRKLLSKYGCQQSMSRKGNCWDNAVAESFIKTIKTESLNNIVFNDPNILKRVIFRYIDGWYNTMRIHSALGYITPLEALLIKSTNLAA